MVVSGGSVGVGVSFGVVVGIFWVRVVLERGKRRGVGLT
jgi:hypothetical protein